MQKHKQFSVFYISILLGTIFSLFSCSNQQAREAGMLPPAQGGKGEVLIVLDSTQWKGELGYAVNKVMREAVPALPQPEPMFTTSFVTPSLFKGLLYRHKNVLFVTNLNSTTNEGRVALRSFTKESLNKIKSDTSLFMYENKDEFASGQRVVHIFAFGRDELIKKIEKNKQRIQDYFNTREADLMKNKLFSVKSEDIMTTMATNHGLKVNLPSGYQIAKDTTDFMWLRFPELRVDRNFFVAYKPYTSEKSFETDSIIAWRNQICQEHLYGDPANKESYVITEYLEPVVPREITRNNQYVKEIRGRWKTKTLSMGGPFISYTFVDSKQGLMYYVEGFVFAPSTKKREYIREMKVVLDSIEL